MTDRYRDHDLRDLCTFEYACSRNIALPYWVCSTPLRYRTSTKYKCQRGINWLAHPWRPPRDDSRRPRDVPLFRFACNYTGPRLAIGAHTCYTNSNGFIPMSYNSSAVVGNQRHQSWTWFFLYLDIKFLPLVAPTIYHQNVSTRTFSSIFL